MHSTRLMQRAALIVGLLAATLSQSASAQVLTDFATDLDGWTIVGDNTHSWNPVAGNPGGCLEVPDNVSGPWSMAVAPARFLGNWRGMGVSDSVSYDVRFVPTSAATGNPPAVFRLSGPLGSAIYRQSIPDSVWVHIAAPLDSSAWTMESGTWSDVLRAVTSFQVAVEYRNGGETVFADNIRLTGTPGEVDLYRPCEASTFEEAAIGWLGEGTATLTRPATGGDIGGYLRVVQSGVGRVILPLPYSGDWSPLEGIGSIGFSFASLGGTVVGGRELRLELAGPGGAAHVRRASEDFVDGARLWHRLEWPLSSPAWILDSGSWAGLLADVQEVALSADLATGTDTYGIDNFHRGDGSCPVVPVLPITLHAPGYSLCGDVPFRDASALARNPADGELYALVNASNSVAAGGGVYRVTGGAGLGVRMHGYSAPKGLVFTADGDGFVSEDTSGDLFRFVGTDSSMLWVDGAVGFHAGDDDIAGLAVAPPGFSGPSVKPGDLLVADWGNSGADEIWAVSPDTANGGTLLVPDPGSADFWDIASSPSGQVFVADAASDNALWSLAPSGVLTAFPLSSTIANMRALVIDAPGNALYALKTTSPLGLYRVGLGDGQVTLIASGFGAFGYGNLEVDEVGRKLHVADSEQNQVYTICLPANVGVGPPRVATDRLSLSVSPNPAAGLVRIRFQLPRSGEVQVSVLDMAGRQVRSIARARLEAGMHALEWDRRDGSGRPLPSGVYFVRVEGGGSESAARVVLMD